jgi:hypothetical protein
MRRRLPITLVTLRSPLMLESSFWLEALTWMGAAMLTSILRDAEGGAMRARCCMNPQTVSARQHGLGQNVAAIGQSSRPRRNRWGIDEDQGPGGSDGRTGIPDISHNVSYVK